MAAPTGKSKNTLVIFLSVLVIILGAALVYVQYSTLSNLRAEVEQEEQALAIAQAHLARLIDLRANADHYEQRLAYATKMIPADAGEEEILRYIYRLADEYDIQALEIRFENRAEGESFTTMPVTMNLEGNYQDLRRFLRRLRDGDRVFRVNNISLSRAGGTGTDLRATITTNTFYNHLEE